MSFLVINTIKAQDIHFSHIHASPTYLNPAMNGVINGGDVRFIINAKEQWNTITNGYKTLNFSTDMKITRLGRNTIVGAGVNLFSDRAGDLDFKTNQFNGALSVVKALDQNNNLISLGFQGGWMTQSFDYTKMVGFDQEEVMDGLVDDQINNWDLSTGLAWYYRFNWHSFFYVGFSASHLNRTDVSFFNRSNISNDTEAIRLFPKYILHGGGSFRISKHGLSVIPSAIYMHQGPHQEINIGSYLKFNKSRSPSDFAIYFGSWLRWYASEGASGIDALQANLRIDVQKTYFTFSYDFNISSLAKVSRGLGSAEVSIIQILDLNGPVSKRTNVICPSF